MAENEGMEGKNIAIHEQQKAMFEQMIIQIANNMEKDRAIITLNEGSANINIEIDKVKEEYKITILGRKIASIDKEKNFSYNIKELESIKDDLENSERPIAKYDELGLPNIEYLKKLEKEKNDNEREENTRNDEEKERDEDKEDEEVENKKDEQEDEQTKKEIAKKYNVSSKDIVHMNTNSKKITENKAFSDLVKWAEGRDDIYVVANKKGSIETVLEKKGNEYEEIDHNMKQIQGNMPNVKIHLVGKEKITTEVPLKIYQIDSKQAFATIRNEWGELETIYCRKQDGKDEYFGEKVPEEKSVKNTRQLGFEERAFMDSKNTSSMDLSKKAKELERAQDHDNRGVPSDEKGVQVEEINGTSTQNIKNEKEKIKEDLYKRKGITEKMKANLMPGQLEYLDKKIDKEADEIQELMSINKDMTYEQAVEQLKIDEKEQENDDNEKTPWDNDSRRNG